MLFLCSIRGLGFKARVSEAFIGFFRFKLRGQRRILHFFFLAFFGDLLMVVEFSLECMESWRIWAVFFAWNRGRSVIFCVSVRIGGLRKLLDVSLGRI